MIQADYHVHSEFSSDSTAPMEEMVEAAIRQGLKRLCFTDHMDYDYPQVDKYSFIFDPLLYIKKLEQLKAKYSGKIELLTGIEMGLQPHIASKMQALHDSYPFDFIIGSSHVVDGVDPYYPEYWEHRTKKQGIHDYFESIIHNCKAYQGFHVYGHIDYIIRYVPGQITAEVKEDYSYPDYAELLDEVLKTILSYDKGIEVNTSALKRGHSHPHPKAEILKRYRELGGELITIGSDAHRPENVAQAFQLMPDFLKSLGFRYYATFIQGKPVYEKL